MITVFEKAALAAGREIMRVYLDGPTIRTKGDDSPVTEADERAEAVIIAALAAAYPAIPVIAEEAMAAGHAPAIGEMPFFLVDPLDGTREFIRRSEDFTVNIALVEGGVPVAGIVYAPARQVAYVGDPSGARKLMVDADFSVTARTPIASRTPPVSLIAVASRSHNSQATLDFLDSHGIADMRSVGSSLKFCLVAEGLADIYPRFGRTMEWDTAAGDAVLRAAGGMTLALDGSPLAYGKRDQADDSDFANPAFLAWGRRPAA